MSVGALVAAAGVLTFAPVFAAGDIIGGASVNEPAERGEQTQIVAPPQRPAPAFATSQVSFNFNWTNSTHPGTLPRNAHFSGPVIAVHNTPGAMFERGAPASQGIENMAERGSQAVLRSELAANPAVSSFDSTGGTGTIGIGTRTFSITASQGFDLVSMVSMIAPSADWFVGLRNFDIFVDGAWVGNSAFNAANYDAGTNTGDNFGVCCETAPRGVVSGPAEPGFAAAAAQKPFAAITITRTG